MKKQQNNSTHAWALHVALSIALLSISAVLLASGFRASPATKGLSAFSAPAAAGHKEPTIEQLASIPSLPAVDAPFTFNNTGSLITARFIHTATLLNNGKVLVAGGTPDFNTPLRSAELYDSASGTWTATGSLNTARFFHTATLLPNGKVLVAGGPPDGLNGLKSAELYDPASGMWTATGDLNTARSAHTATLLPNGKVLVAGGQGTGGGFLTSAELYDPASGTWTTTGSLTNARQFHTATLLPNGKVLVAGGYNNIFPNPGALDSAELYDPASGTWTTTDSLNMARDYHTATLLPNGKVLVAGGEGTSAILNSAELYDTGLGFVRPDWQP